MAIEWNRATTGRPFVNNSEGEYSDSLWMFGDGMSSTQTITTHVYAMAGVYTASLTVGGPGGSDSMTRTNYITATPRVDFLADPTLGSVPLTVNFTDTSQITATDRFWDFGDSILVTRPVTVANPSHEYTIPGTYTVTLTITDDLGIPYVATKPGHIAALEAITEDTWVQTNWGGGDGQIYWNDTTRYWRDDGHIDTSQPGQISILPGPGDIQINKVDTPSDLHSDPAIAVDDNGNSCVAWVRTPDDGEGRQLYLQRFDADGTRLWSANDVLVSETVTDTAFSYRHAAVAADTAGNCYVAWEDIRDGYVDIYAQRYDSDGTPGWQNDVRVPATGASRNQPDIDIDPAATALIVVWENETIPSRIYAQSLDPATGTRQWVSDRQVNHTTYSSHSDSATAIDSSGSCFFAGWREGDSIHVNKQAVSAGSCTEWSSPITVTVGNSLQYPYRPDVATDGNGNLYVTWMDQRVGRGWWNLYAQKYDSSGNKAWNDDLKINPVESLSSAAVGSSAIDIDAAGNFYVAWMDAQFGTEEVFLQKLDGSGSRVWDHDVQAAVDAASWQASLSVPALAVDPDGNSYVVWGDSRYELSDIFGQKHDTTGDSQWRQRSYGTLRSSIFGVDYVSEWGPVSWTATEPPSTTVQVEVSADEGLTWTPTTNGAELDLAGPSLTYRVTLSTTDSYTTPVLHDLDIGYAPGTEPSPEIAVGASEYELEAAQLINQERIARGLAPLKINEQLSRAAHSYSASMAAAQNLSHYLSPSGFERCEAEGFACWPGGCRFGGEVIAGGDRTPASVVNSWMESAGHHEALLDPDSREIGVGYATDSSNDTYWTAESGSQPNVIPIFIDNDAEWTSSRFVTVTLHNEFSVSSSSSDSIMGRATQVQVSLSPTFKRRTQWITYPLVTGTITETGFDDIEYYIPLTVPVTLSPEPGEKTVYARFKDENGRMTTSQDSIRYVRPTPTDSITMPMLPPAMAYFQSALSVGAATFDYPIEVAPGTAGLEPSLVLHYSSYVADDSWEQQSGWTGLGTSLDMGFIVRKPDTTPDDTSDDLFVLYLNGVYYPLVYADPELGGDGYYHTERETFWRIERLSGAPHGVDDGEYWRVTTQSGTQHRFGYSVDSAWRYVADGSGTQHIYRYNLDRIEDTHDNYLTASYLTDTVDYSGSDYERGGYLSQVLYTGNSSTGAPARRRVDFGLVDREIDAQRDYTVTARYYLTQTLGSIAVEVDDGTGNWELVRRYDLDYTYQTDGSDPAVHHLLLDRITQVGSDGTSVLEETDLSYYAPGQTAEGRLWSASDNYGAKIEYGYEAFEAPAGKERVRMINRTDDPGAGGQTMSAPDTIQRAGSTVEQRQRVRDDHHLSGRDVSPNRRRNRAVRWPLRGRDRAGRIRVRAGCLQHDR